MTYHDKVQLTLIIIAPPDQVAEGDRIFKSHGSWMGLLTTVQERKLS